MAKQIFSPNTKGGKFKLASGDHTTVTAADVVTTGLVKVLGCVASMESDPVLTCDRASAVPVGATAPGSITIKTQMPTSSSVTTPIAATTFSKKVNWLAWGY
jgi:hypothetical protein